jgi:hypothetical protein
MENFEVLPQFRRIRVHGGPICRIVMVPIVFDTVEMGLPGESGGLSFPLGVAGLLTNPNTPGGTVRLAAC